MHELVARKRRDIEELCRALPVRRLDVFGSAVGESFNVETSDVDVLVEFGGGPGFDCFDAYFSLREGLERILGRPVDVVSASSIRNPYFKQRGWTVGNSSMRRDARGTIQAADLSSEFSKGEDLTSYQSDAKLRSAVERQLEIIGEAMSTWAASPVSETPSSRGGSSARESRFAWRDQGPV